ncbi:Histidine kinase-, DNA gyrase B-, and HSP90-like ATPase [Hydrobacter penzbergensis]|jgi:signal transduction histidine kinase|uniref:histidine kinase n=1 Tax=Hydrobacter penzbergensis TaxID=1235997 RepID=A0A8X8LDG4_9BACT|nr:ATP-binding protein [Hydrobacter penzbergensis]MBN8717903.1 ATP-binding protein [Sediminibacterium magnilacihabitans]PQV61494.1 histidine kinase/DNA gyrase B/HSP90-like ATPase [Sediminibacterium magnilacihabitans]SDW49079.1 Histidine kinase-, DNA gyrase B-, and HSP90-like ATPase [Hydrobacter penzbergensis]
MIPSWLNWRTILVFIAVLIVSGTIFYSNYLAGKIAWEERKNVEAWVEAQRTILNASPGVNLNLATKISTENNRIPIIETNEKDQITGNYLNLDSQLVKSNPHYLAEKLQQFKRYNRLPIVLIIHERPYTANKYYYGESSLLKEVKLYPIVQLIIIALFIAIAIIATRSYYQSAQNKLWAAMARETAHQLGTPVSSLQGWLEILKEQEANASIVPEISKDVNRLLLITDRFGKIGSLPKLERSNPTEQIQHMLEYMKKRTGGHVQFEFNGAALAHANPLLSPPLFDWVLENLIKNALDAIEGNGKISIRSQVNDRKEMILDITDTGKGIPKNNLNKVFKPGFTTKKRGWGLGLPLCKRIIEEYHKGRLFVKSSEPGKGTTFRIVLPA